MRKRFTGHLVRWRSCPFWCFFFILSLLLCLKPRHKIRIWHFSSDILRCCHSPTLAGLPAWISKGCEFPRSAISSTEKSEPCPADTEFSQRLSLSSCAHEVVKADAPTFVSRHRESRCFALAAKRFYVARLRIRASVELCRCTSKTFLCVLNKISGSSAALQLKCKNK